MSESIFNDSMEWGMAHVCFLMGGNYCLPQHGKGGFSLTTITPMGMGKP